MLNDYDAFSVFFENSLRLPEEATLKAANAVAPLLKKSLLECFID